MESHRLGARPSARASRLSRAIRSLLIAVPAAQCFTSFATLAQDIGPGAIAPPVAITTGTPRIVGNTTVTATGTTHAVYVTGGALLIDMQAGPSPGATVFNTQNGNGLFADGGTVTVPVGLNVFTVGGHAVVANGANSSISLTAGQLGSTGVGAGLVAIAGGRITATATNINNVATATPTISNGHGAIAESGGQITLGAGNQISTAGFNAVGLGASGAGSLVQQTAATLLPITMNGRGSLGIYLHDGGQVQTVANTQFAMNATNGVGVTADNTAVQAGTIGSGLTINFAAAPITGQAGGTGVVAFNNGSISLDTFRVSGPGGAAGAWARAGSTITLTGTSDLQIHSAFNPTYYVLQTANLATVNGPVGSIFSVVGGTPMAGLKTDGGRIVSTGTTINVSSPAGYGAWTSINSGGPGTIDLTNNTITTTGANSSALFAGSNGAITGRTSRLTTNGGGGAALQVYTFTGPGSIDLTDSVVVATGADTLGLYSANLTASTVNRIDLSGGSLTSEDAAIAGTGPSDVFIDSGATVSSPSWLMYALTSASFAPPQPTVLQVSADNATLQGDAGADTRSIGNLQLANASHWTGSAYYLTNASVDATSLWTVTKDSLLTARLANAGRIAFTVPEGGDFKELWTRDYVASGGTLAVNTFLGTDNSPSDLLILYAGGSGTGQGLLEVANAGGPGDITAGNGILVVQAIQGATTAPNLLALSSRVVAGPYEYTLQRGSVDADSPHNWYLRSSLDCSGPGAPVPPCPAPDPDPPPDPDPDPPAPPPPTPDPPPDPPPIPDPPEPAPEPPLPPLPPLPPPIPAYRAEVSLYAGLAPTALQYGKSLLDTLHERVGEQEQLRGRADLDEGDRIDGFWGRLMYVDGEKDAEGQGIYDRGPAYDYQFAAVQLGMDLRRHEDDDGTRTHTGVYGAIGLAETQVEHVFRNLAGDIRIDGYTLGGYWTRYSEREAYIDTVLQATWYDAQANSATHDLQLDTEGWGLAASVEGGYPFHPREDWTLEPQGQLIYGWLDLDDSSDLAADVRFEDTESLIGRLSLRVSRDWSRTPEPARELDRTGWLRLSAWYDFKGDATTEFSARNGFIPFHSDMGGGWWELEAGFTGDMDRNRFIYANVGYQQGFDDDRRSWEAKLGFRANW